MFNTIPAFVAGVAAALLAVMHDIDKPKRAGTQGYVVRAAGDGMMCWPIPNGDAHTTVCSNGFWSTIMPDGTVVQGNGVVDPFADLKGSGIVIDPSTGRPTGRVTMPDQPAAPGPGQWWFGAPAPSR